MMMTTNAKNKMPWFLQAPLSGGATVVEISWATVMLHGGATGTTYLGTDVPEDDFASMLARAARHEGYKGNQRDVRETIAGDVRLAYEDRGTAGILGAPSAAAVTCERRVLCEVREIPGTPLIVRTYRRDRMPSSAFPCDVKLDHAVRSRRLELRAHARSRLVFDVTSKVTDEHGGDVGERRVVRSVRMEIDVEARGGRGGSRGSIGDDWEDLRRTTENTIQNVFLGMKPRRPPRGGV